MEIESVAVYSDADAGSLHVRQADHAVRIGAPPARLSYLDVDAIIDAARRSGAEAIHPGYGFLSENVDFAARCAKEGIDFIGPSVDTMRIFSLKHTARALAVAEGVPVLPGSGLLTDLASAHTEALRIGYPVMLKATAGGGGIGMRVCESEIALTEAYAAVVRLAGSNFADGGVFVERFVPEARHIEVQIFGDVTGKVIALGERDCSLQRRNQKVIEETPAPHLPAETRSELLASAVRLCQAVNYRSAGTVEFLYDTRRDEFYFLEVNTRLQVEHGITEQVAGVDLVEWMVRTANGDASCVHQWPGHCVGASIEARLYAEDPGQDYRPSAGQLSYVAFPDQARIETWVESGSEVSAHYDPMLGKVIVTAPDRAAAVRALHLALESTALAGLETNLHWLRCITQSEPFVSGRISTRTLAEIPYSPDVMRVRASGLSTTIQELPGRLGYWAVGVPPSGPMDALSFALGNRLLGNPPGEAGLEITASGPTLEFCAPAVVCLTGATLAATLDGAVVPPYEPLSVRAGQVLMLGRIDGPGMRAYLLIAGGLDVPPYLGSRATFTLGGFGGHAGRALVAGDVLRFGRRATGPVCGIQSAARPVLMKQWTVRVLHGPHGAPDFFTSDDIVMLLAAVWKVHYNSNRTGVRLVGPKPSWARRDGGEAGLHPSNIHDNAYAIGAIDFTGDMPILLGPDGPSLGGFVCPFVAIEADLWMLGQLTPGDSVQFVAVDHQAARLAADAQRGLVETGTKVVTTAGPSIGSPTDAVLAVVDAAGDRPRAIIRRQGDRNLLIEYGPMVLDIELRLRVHALMLELQRLELGGVVDITPGIRSLQVHYDPHELPQALLLEALRQADDKLGTLEGFTIPSRIVHLPLSWRDPAVQQTIQKYMASVRDDAPWCPDNIEFIRRVNGLPSVQDVEQVVFGASYLVMGLGDVYLGAPVATPLDPRHRLVTTKYNPARTWTPPNVVGIGGAYLCVYGMEGPGGYQLFGRTIQVWNSHRQTDAFVDGNPWLLRFFDQIRFFPVTAEELVEWRRDFPLGRRSIRTEQSEFNLSEYRRFLADNHAQIAAFEAARQAAFADERAEWERCNEFARIEDSAGEPTEVTTEARSAPAGTVFIEAPFGGSVIRVDIRAGDRIEKGGAVAIIEAMKTECVVTSPSAGIIREIYATERQDVAPGMPLAAIQSDA